MGSCIIILYSSWSHFLVGKERRGTTLVGLGQGSSAQQERGGLVRRRHGLYL